MKQDRSLSLFFRRVVAAVGMLQFGACAEIVGPGGGDASPNADASVVGDGGSDAGVGDADRCTPIVMSTPGCMRNTVFPCGIPGVSAGSLTPQQCMSLCNGFPGGQNNCLVRDLGAGGMELVCGFCALGRRPSGFSASGNESTENELGCFFATCTELEAASVPAFRQLVKELQHYDAPELLQLEAMRSIEDERRHVRAMRALAAKYGGTPRKKKIRVGAPRSLFALARDNAVEGCVRETAGALLAHFQAERAADPEVRAALREIANDETRHAELSWAIDAWIQPLLTEEEQALVARAREQAVQAFVQEASLGFSRALQGNAGLPNERESKALFRVLYAALWSEEELVLAA